uniref:Peptidase A1 domain-containing protein n=1 Tax=Meloidogyne incognita TaxID=6306 RepID=A0A914KTI8_MELIC
MMNVGIGTPSQKFNVLLSTGSADFFVPAFNITTNKPKFFPKKSSTFSSPNPQKYLNFPEIRGEVQGIVGIDTIEFAGLKQPKLEFSMADLIDNQTLADPYDGIMGLGFAKLSKAESKNPVLSAIDNNLLAQKMFTLYLKGGYTTNSKNMQGGQATFGGYDTKNCGQRLGSVKFIGGGLRYQFQIDSVSIQGNVASGGTQAISDSSSGDIIGNRAVIDKFTQQVGARWSDSDGAYIIHCRATPSLTLKLGGVDYTLTKDFLIYRIASNKCGLAVGGMDRTKEGFDWVLGSPFMRKFCHTFDIKNNQLTFSQVKNL